MEGLHIVCKRLTLVGRLQKKTKNNFCCWNRNGRTDEIQNKSDSEQNLSRWAVSGVVSDSIVELLLRATGENNNFKPQAVDKTDEFEKNRKRRRKWKIKTDFRLKKLGFSISDFDGNKQERVSEKA